MMCSGPSYCIVSLSLALVSLRTACELNSHAAKKFRVYDMSDVRFPNTLQDTNEGLKAKNSFRQDDLVLSG